MRVLRPQAEATAVDSWLYRLSIDGPTLLGTSGPDELLSEDERARAESIGTLSANGRQLRDRFCLRRAILRIVLARQLGAHAQALEFDRRCRLCGDPTHGKPRLVGYPGIDFSCAYRSDVIAIAVSATGLVGIDVEETAGVDVREVEGLAATVLTERDSQYWPPPEAASDAERVVAFCRAFVAKEACGKLTGRGLVGESQVAADLSLSWLSAPTGYLAAVAFSPS